MATLMGQTRRRYEGLRAVQSDVLMAGKPTGLFLPHTTTYIYILHSHPPRVKFSPSFSPSIVSFPQLRLEEKQRAKRKLREAAAARMAQAASAGNHELAAELEKEATYTPVWFEKEYDPLTNQMMHVYRGGYWEAKSAGDWGRKLPDIY